MIHEDSNNIVAIASGIFLNITNYLIIMPVGFQEEASHVLVLGIIGGAGGLIGKLIIQKLYNLLKKLTK